MTQRKLRARDADRDAAIELVESAWADGQLTRDEYEQRVDRLLQAPTLSDLEREILDLQPDGVEWRPSPSADLQVIATSKAPPGQNSHITPRRRTGIFAVLGVVGVAFVALLIRSINESDHPEPLLGREQPVADTSLLTPAAFVLVRSELDDHTGSDAVYSAVLTKDRFDVVHPVTASGTDAVETVWDGKWGADRPTSSSGERLSLSLVNAQAVSTILADAHEQVGEGVELALRFQIERRGGQRVCITATAAEDKTWTGTYDCRGQKLGR